MKFIAKNTLKGATNEKCLSPTICRALSTRYPPSPFTIHGFIYITRHIIPCKSEIHLLLGIIYGVPLPGNVFLRFFLFFPTHSLRFSFLSFFFPFCFDEILAIYDLDDGRPRSRNRTNNLHFHGKIECHRTSTSIEFQRFHIFHFISFPSFLPTPSSIPSRSSVRIELSFNHANTPSATIKLRSSLLRNYLTSTNQLTCCRERESFEAGICISFVRRKVSKYLCGIVTWLPFTCDLSSSPNQDSIV